MARWHGDELLSLEGNPGYIAAVADGLDFALGTAWERLTAHDDLIQRSRVRAELDYLRDVGVRIDFGDGEVPTIPQRCASAIAALSEQLERIRAAAPVVLASGADTSLRLLCTDPWPRIYTTAVLQWPASTPVHVIQASDLVDVPEQWARVPELATFHELRVLIMFGAPLGSSPWPFELGTFRELQAVNLSASGIRALPPTLAGASALEAIELAGNPLDAASLEVLAQLPRLRYVGLRNTCIAESAIAALRLRGVCEVVLA